jgi:hypothetical protein
LSGGSEDSATGRSRTAVTRVEVRRTRIKYVTRERFSGLGLKTIGGGFRRFVLKTSCGSSGNLE